MAKTTTSPRKKLFISGPIQGRLSLRMTVYWILYHFVLWNVLFAYEFIANRFTHSMPTKPFGAMYADFVDRYFPLLVCAIGMLPIFLIDLVRLSHRIAGPLLRFQGVLRRMTEGEAVQKVRLRKGDLLTEFEAVFNDYIEQYEHRRQSDTANYRMNPDEVRLLEQVVELKQSIQQSTGRGDTTLPSDDTATMPLAKNDFAEANQTTEELTEANQTTVGR